MSFRITSYAPGRDDQAVESHPFMREQLPFPTEAWRSMLTPVRTTRRPTDDTSPRAKHPAELALEEVERNFQRAVISINEAMEAEEAQVEASLEDPSDFRPRAA